MSLELRDIPAQVLEGVLGTNQAIMMRRSGQEKDLRDKVVLPFNLVVGIVLLGSLVLGIHLRLLRDIDAGVPTEVRNVDSINLPKRLEIRNA